MSKPLQKSLQGYISKIKESKSYSRKFYVSRRKILRACKHSRTRSVAVGDAAATLADIDKFLFENFNSLYLEDDNEDEDEKNKEIQEVNCGLSSPDDEENPGTILLESPRLADPPPDLSGSHRFFVGSTSSSSLMTKSSTIASDDKHPSPPAAAAAVRMGADDFITILKYSPSPYNDFRSSMEEMIEAHLNDGEKVDWEFMEELLLCYLDLNEKKSHKYVLSAFVDIVVVLREKSSKVPVKSRRTRRPAIGREVCYNASSLCNVSCQL